MTAPGLIPGQGFGEALARGVYSPWRRPPFPRGGLACARRIARLPRQAVESTKRILNIGLERAVLAAIDYAVSSEESTFASGDFRATIAKLAKGKAPASLTRGARENG